MKALQKPKFRTLSHGECAGVPILKTLWDRFDFSLLLTQSGIFKRCGAPSWLICFLYVIGLVSNCSSVNQIADLAEKDALLKIMFKPWKLAQYTLSRFLCILRLENVWEKTSRAIATRPRNLFARRRCCESG
jgi:hypothetical protein